METYTVVTGDTLSKIAKKFYGDGNAFRIIAEANGIVNPNVISVGQVLVIPPLGEEPQETPVPNMVETKARVLSINCRNKVASRLVPPPPGPDSIFPSRKWPKRLPQLVKLIQNAGASVVGTQECGDDMAVDITNGLGARWNFWGAGTSKVLWDSNEWNVLDEFQAGLPYTDKSRKIKDRPITMVSLQSVATGGRCWFVSTHLVVHQRNEAAQRLRQAKEAIRLIGERPEHEHVVVFGDFNDVQFDSATMAVRKVFAAAGYNHLRARLSDEAMDGDGLNSFNGWKPTKSEGRWLDDILTSKAVKPYAGELMVTDRTKFPVYASDHNGVLARVRFLDEVAV
jgi:endonuclease/exonuclease/phosphatase family metal-dependent hydrolase/LysM repeat protein